MLNITLWRYSDLQPNESALRRLTGLKREEFELLHDFFGNELTNYFAHYTLEGRPRNRKAFRRKNTIFADTQDALLFVLVYLKGRVRQEQLALFFGIDQPKASKYVKLFSRILFQVIKTYPEAISRYKREQILNSKNKNDKSRTSVRHISENSL